MITFAFRSIKSTLIQTTFKVKRLLINQEQRTKNKEQRAKNQEPRQSLQ